MSVWCAGIVSIFWLIPGQARRQQENANLPLACAAGRSTAKLARVSPSHRLQMPPTGKRFMLLSNSEAKVRHDRARLGNCDQLVKLRSDHARLMWLGLQQSGLSAGRVTATPPMQKQKKGRGLASKLSSRPNANPFVRRPWRAVVQMEAMTTAISKFFRSASVPSYVPALINCQHRRCYQPRAKRSVREAAGLARVRLERRIVARQSGAASVGYAMARRCPAATPTVCRPP
jgi:hypothetical protein